MNECLLLKLRSSLKKSEPLISGHLESTKVGCVRAGISGGLDSETSVQRAT